MKKLNLLVILVIVLIVGGCVNYSSTEISSSSDLEWSPNRAITIYLYSGAGGDTDIAMRALANHWKDYFGVPVNIVNMTGGAGGIAANHVYNQPADGYTLFGMADGVNAINVLGAFDKPNDVWDIMVLFGGKGVIGVPINSPYNSIEEVIEASINGVNIRVGTSSTGSIWHVKGLQLASMTGAPLNALPYDGSNQAVIAMLSGEVDVVISSLGEQSDFILSGQIKPLSTLENESAFLDGYGEIESIVNIYPTWASLPQARQWNGVGMRVDLPEQIRNTYKRAFIAAVDSGDLDMVKVNRRTEYINLIDDDAKKFVQDGTSAVSWALYDIGVALRSPLDFGIQR